MHSRLWVFLFISIVYVGCVGHAPLDPNDPTPRPERSAGPGLTLPDPPLIRLHEPPPPVSLELSLRDQVVEMAFLRLDEVAHLLVLGRRTLSLIRIEPAAIELLHQADLLSSMEPGARFQRHARGCLQFLALSDGTVAPGVHLFSTGLGFPTIGSAAFHIQDGRLIAQQPVWRESGGELGPCDAFLEASQYGWPGRTLVLWSSRNDPSFFHLTLGGSLSVSMPSGEERVLYLQSGELLASAGDLDAARIYASSPALPGDPDHVQEYQWDGYDLLETRRSREFNGPLAALVLLPDDGRFVVAQAEPSGSLLHILREADLWLEAGP